MTTAMPVYSSLFQCLFDQPRAEIGFGYHYSVFRAIDARDVEQKPAPLPCVHDFAVIWDDDHDTRIIPVLEEMLMAGILPGVQFIGEHKGELTIILAARTYWLIDVEAFARRVKELCGKAAGDFWTVVVGMYDHAPGNLRFGHQCDFKEILGMSDEATHAYLYTIDTTWNLGTKQWIGADAPSPPLAPGTPPRPPSRYTLSGARRGSEWPSPPALE